MNRPAEIKRPVNGARGRVAWTASCARFERAPFLSPGIHARGISIGIAADSLSGKATRHQTRAMFDRYHVVAESALRDAAERLNEAFGRRTATVLATVAADEQPAGTLTHSNAYDAGVVELADTQDLKSCGGFPRTGSIPVPGTAFSATYNSALTACLLVRRTRIFPNRSPTEAATCSAAARKGLASLQGPYHALQRLAQSSSPSA